jgi:hypothetical protein
MTRDSKINLLTDVFDCYRLIKGKTNKQPLQQKQLNKLLTTCKLCETF